MNTVNNKLVLVTGATGGIGKAVCRLLYNKGAVVVGINRNLNKKAEYVQQQFSADLSSCADVHKLCTEIIQKYGVPDLIIHCSGALIPGTLTSLSYEEIISVMNSNFISLINISRYFIPAMENKGKGHLIIIGSLGGIVPMPYSALYSSMKFAVRGFCLSLVQELKDKGIKISLISPGPVKTSMLDTEAFDDNSTISFIQKPAEPEDIAKKVFSLIRRPRVETVLPATGKLVSLLFNIFPGLFNNCFKLLRKAGAAGMRSYRSDILHKGTV